MTAHICAGTHPRVFLGVMNHAPTDIHFSVESDICSALNVLIQYLVESSLGVIHLVRTHEEGEGDQANAYKCIQGGGGLTHEVRTQSKKL